MPFNWKSLKGYPLATFFAGNDAYTYCDDGVLYSWNPARTTVQANIPPKGKHVKISKIDRLVFHDKSTRNGAPAGTFLTGFNVINTFSSADYARGSLIIYAPVRCMLQGLSEDRGDGTTAETISIQAKFDSERLANCWISHLKNIQQNDPNTIDLLKPKDGSARQKSLKQALADLASGQTDPVQLGADKIHPVYTEWSEMLRSLLNFKPGKDTIEGNRLPDELSRLKAKFAGLTVSFRENDDKSGQYLIEFEASFFDAYAQGIQCFSIAPSSGGNEPQETEARFQLADGQSWFFRQRASVQSCTVASRAELDAIPEWTLELQCLSQTSTAERLTHWTQSAVEGLRRFGGVGASSFLPSLSAPSSGPGLVFTAIYQIADRSMNAQINGKLFVDKFSEPDKTVVRPLSVQYVGHRNARQAKDSIGNVTLAFPLCATTVRKPLELRVSLCSDRFSNRDTLEGFSFCSQSPLESVTEKRSVRMGSIELSFGARSDSQHVRDIYFRLSRPGEVSLNGWFVLAGLLPGGQDDLPDDSFAAPNAEASAMPICRLGRQPDEANDDEKVNVAVERMFYRPKPLLINRKNSSDAPLLLQVVEQAGPAVSHSLEISVSVDNTVASVVDSTPQQTIVIDADPFLVAQSSFPQLLSQGDSPIVASWSVAGDGAGKWQIPLTKSGFSLALPSQVMGEEMVKDTDFAQPPIDFRMGPPAVVAMESGPQRTAYAEVPWNLRRILGYASQTSPGVTVNRLDYELLYGLSCDASLPWVRLAEVFAVFGAIPGRLPQKLATGDPAFGPAQQAAGQYASWRKEWARLYQRYQARLAVLEPQDSHVSGSTTLKHGMSCVIRYDVDKAQRQCSQTLGKALLQFAPDNSTAGHPYRLPYADLDDPITPTLRGPSSPLRGGVTWGFESRNVFCATLRDEFSTADSAAVSDLDITSLGGYGHQQASFDEGRTAIFGDASLGRTYYYKLERVGRIAVFWNKAKHVIVYERSVVPSRQFYLEQNPDQDGTASYGIPMLRKVEEYVEILEDERRFPDDHVLTNATPTGNATPAQRCGCVAACVFQKGARIKVSSAWGSDVNSHIGGKVEPIGWKVPLWKRGQLPEDVYPLPKISLSLFSDFGGSSKESPCDVANPEAVYFFTDTREGNGSDTDKWVAILGVDTVDLPPTRPVQSSGSSVLPTLGDVPMPAGFSTCTFRLFPPLRSANIVANRGGTAMAVVLDSVTMMRGCTSPQPIAGASLDLLKVIDTYSGRWEKELQALAPADWTKANLLSAVGRISTDVNNALTTAKGTITKQWTDAWRKQVDSFNDSAIARLANQLQTGTSDGSAVVGGIQRVQKDVAEAIASISGTANPEVRLQQLVAEQFAAIQKVVLDASATPGILTTLVVQYYAAARGVVSKVSVGIQQLKSTLNSLPSQAQDAVAQLTKQVLDLRTDLKATWDAAASVRPIPEMVDIADGLTAGPLQDFWSQYDPLLQQLTDSVNSQAADYNLRLTDLKKKIGSLKALDAKVTSELDRLAALLKGGFSGNASGPLTYLDFFRNDLTFVDPGGTALTWAGDTHQKLVAAIASGPQAVQKAFGDAFNGFNSKLTGLQNAMADEAKTLGQDVTKAVGQIKGDVSSSLAHLNSSLTAALQNLPDVAITPQQIADVQRAVLQFRDAQLAEAHQYVDKYLGLFRSTAVDVTSNTNQFLSLVRCFGDAPVANTLNFLPGKIGYYFQCIPTQVDLSPVTSILRQAGNVANDASGVLNDALNVMHLQVPMASLADRLVPPDLSSFRLSDIFPKFAGIDLSHLLQGINLNENGDKMRISHGTDPQTTSAWVQADIGAHLQDVPVFDTGGISLRLQTADFVGQVRVDVSPQGTRQAATGKIVGNWALLVLGQQAVTLAATQLLFDNSGKLQFKVDPKNVQLPGVLDFVTQYLAPFLGGGNGLSIHVEGTQVLALLNLPIPDVSGVTSGISNLSLSCKFGVGLVDGQFQLDVGFGLSDPQKPFNIAFFILGGSGYLTATTTFRPAVDKAPSCRVDFGIMASASLAIAFGPISGGVYAFLGIRAGFSTGGPGLSLAAVLLLRGQVNLAGIISASVCMELAATYDGHQLTGSGSFSISVTICWCFTLNISVGIRYPIGSFSGHSLDSQLENRERQVLVASLAPVSFDPDAAGQAGTPDDLGMLISDYVAMTKGI